MDFLAYDVEMNKKNIKMKFDEEIYLNSVFSKRYLDFDDINTLRFNSSLKGRYLFKNISLSALSRNEKNLPYSYIHFEYILQPHHKEEILNLLKKTKQWKNMFDKYKLDKNKNDDYYYIIGLIYNYLYNIGIIDFEYNVKFNIDKDISERCFSEALRIDSSIIEELDNYELSEIVQKDSDEFSKIRFFPFLKTISADGHKNSFCQANDSFINRLISILLSYYKIKASMKILISEFGIPEDELGAIETFKLRIYEKNLDKDKVVTINKHKQLEINSLLFKTKILNKLKSSDKDDVQNFVDYWIDIKEYDLEKSLFKLFGIRMHNDDEKQMSNHISKVKMFNKKLYFAHSKINPIYGYFISKNIYKSFFKESFIQDLLKIRIMVFELNTFEIIEEFENKNIMVSNFDILIHLDVILNILSVKYGPYVRARAYITLPKLTNSSNKGDVEFIMESTDEQRFAIDQYNIIERIDDYLKELKK